jgi:hypothetical protein
MRDLDARQPSSSSSSADLSTFLSITAIKWKRFLI